MVIVTVSKRVGESDKEFRIRNRDHQRRFREKNPNYCKLWYGKHREKEKKRVNNWQKNNKEKRNTYMRDFQRKYRQKIRLEVFIHYSGNPPYCQCCGESNIKFLTIDHINNDGYKKGTKRAHICEQLKWQGFPEGYQVLCWNCNCGRQYNNGICPHKEKSTNAFERPVS